MGHHGGVSTTSPARTPTPVAPAEWLAAAGVACVGVAAVMSPAGIDDGPVICPFRRLTGLECPGCGLTRSWVHAMHGNLGTSWAEHPFGIPLLLFVLGLAVTVLVRRARRRPAPDLNRLVRNPVSKLVLAGWLGFAVARLVTSLV